MASRIPDHLLSEKQLKKREYNRAHREKISKTSEKMRKRNPEKKVRNQLEKKFSNLSNTKEKEEVLNEKYMRNQSEKSEKFKKVYF